MFCPAVEFNHFRTNVQKERKDSTREVRKGIARMFHIFMSASLTEDSIDSGLPFSLLLP
jgi:hypothetical protein